MAYADLIGGRAARLALAGSALLAVAAGALAHGGSHPTPWPTPSTPPPTPGRPTPSNPPPSGPSTPSGPTTTGPGTKQGPANTGWETWWEINKWQFTKLGFVDTVRTGGPVEGGGPAAGEVRTRLTAWLTAGLKHEWFDVRSSAALALGKAGDATAVPALVALLQDEQRDAREGAVIGLGLMKDQSVIPTLVKEIFENPARADDARLRALTAIALGFIGDKAATTELVNEYRRATNNREVRFGCIAGLGLLKDTTAVPVLYEILINGAADKHLRAYAASALGKCGFPEFTLVSAGGKSQTRSVVDELLARLAADKEEVVRQSAVLAVGALGGEAQFERVYAATADKDRMVQKFALVTLPRLAGANERYRTAALGKLTASLTGGDHGTRGFAALGLGLLKDPRALMPLQTAFNKESDPSLRSACAIGLGLLGEKASVMLLSGAILGSMDPKLNGYCCVALGLIGDPAAAKSIRNVLTTSVTPEVKAAAAMGLANIGDREALPVLLAGLKERNNYARQSTIVALGYFRDASTIAPLQAVFDDKQAGNDTRTIVVVSLGYIVDRFPKPVLKTLGLDFNYTLPGDMLELVLRLF